MKLHLGENIRENRRRMGLTQEQLADRIGVAFQSVSRWENGTTYPDMEKLPEIARLFDTTIDELMGYEEKEEKMPIEKLEEMYAYSSGMEDWEACAKIIRKVRYEYMDELNQGFTSFLYDFGWKKTHKNPVLMEEVRLLADEYLRMGNNGCSRSTVIWMLAAIEEEDKIADFLKKYASLANRGSKYELLENRYRTLGDREKYLKYHYFNKIHRILNFLIPPETCDEEENPEKWCLYSERQLDMLNSLSGIKKDERYPLSGDGEIDIFSLSRLNIASVYAVQLCGCGRYEEALGVMEDMAGLIEKMTALPNNADIVNRCPLLEGLHLVKNAGWNEESEKIGCISQEVWRSSKKYDSLEINVTAGFFVTGDVEFYFEYGTYAEGHRNSQWLDPIRDNPRYAEVMRRVDEACRTHMDDDGGYRQSFKKVEAYQKGRKAIGKEERRPSH